MSESDHRCKACGEYHEHGACEKQKEESSFAAPTLLGHVTPECLDAEDWLQVEMASRGCVSGTLNEWTKLRRAMLAAGLEAWPTMPSSAMRDVCRLLMSHCPNAGVSDRRDNPKR